MRGIKMNKCKVYEIFFNTISESFDWADGCEDYPKYVSGAVDMTMNIIEELDSKGESSND